MSTTGIVYLDYAATTPVDPRVVEVMTPCPIAFGRKNRMPSGVKLMQWLKEFF